jgi:hypothetical protein
MPGPVAFDQITHTINRDPGAPGRVNIIEGNNQTVNPGQASSPLIVQVTDAAGNVISPIGRRLTVSGTATLSTTASKTDSVGKAQTIATFSPNASGQVTVRALSPGAQRHQATFVLHPRLIGSLTRFRRLADCPIGTEFPSGPDCAGGRLTASPCRTNR